MDNRKKKKKKKKKNIVWLSFDKSNKMIFYVYSFKFVSISNGQLHCKTKISYCMVFIMFVLSLLNNGKKWLKWLIQLQWRNRQGGRGQSRGQSAPPETSDREIFADVSGKKARKKRKRGENWEEKKENYKREGGKKLNEGGKSYKKRWGPFFFLFFFSFHFWKRRKSV